MYNLFCYQLANDIVRIFVLSNEIVFYKTRPTSLPRSYRAKRLFTFVKFFGVDFFLIHLV